MFDISELQEAIAGRGLDPRSWISMGTVEPGEDSVTFLDEQGNVSPIGPIVKVQLQPSAVVLPCRVASSVAGVEEADWVPFIPGDEVVVAIPQGVETSGGVILGRTNQAIDRFPLRVAGQDVTKNNFGFKRLRTPYIIETASSFMIRSALTGAGFTIDQTGNAYLVSGDGHRMTLHGSFLKLETESGSSFIQIDTTADEVVIQGGQTTQLSLAKDFSSFFSLGQLDIGTGGQAGVGHAITIEQVIGMLINYTCFLGAAGVTPINTLLLGGMTPIDASFAAFITAAAKPIPPTGPTPGGAVYGVMPLTFTAIKTALIDPSSNLPDPTGLIPGFGRPNLTF